MSVTSYLGSLEYNGQSLLGGSKNVTEGGYTTRNAPFAFARLLQQLQQPGGVLSEVTRSRTFAGEAEGIVSQGDAIKDQTSQQLQQQGVNEAQATQQLAQVDQSVLQALSQAQAESEGALAENEANALTQLTNVVTQSEDIQKTRTEELRQYEELMSMIKKQQRFQNILGVAGLALNFFPGIGTAISAGLGKFGGKLGGLFGAEGPDGGDQSVGNLGLTEDLFQGSTPGDLFSSQANGIGPAPPQSIGPQLNNPQGLVPYRLPSLSSAFQGIQFPQTTQPVQGPSSFGPSTTTPINIQELLANAFN